MILLKHKNICFQRNKTSYLNHLNLHQVTILRKCHVSSDINLLSWFNKDINICIWRSMQKWWLNLKKYRQDKKIRNDMHLSILCIFDWIIFLSFKGLMNKIVHRMIRGYNCIWKNRMMISSTKARGFVSMPNPGYIS